jgi:hypothetical protein
LARARCHFEFIRKDIIMRRLLQLLIAILTEQPQVACCNADIHWANFR